MLLKIQLIFVSLIIVDGASLHTASPIIIKLKTEQIIDALTSNGSVSYIENLAKIFATKAAEHFLEEIRNKEREIDKKYKLDKANEFLDRSEKSVLDETEALVLMAEPPPDGDNLGHTSEDLSIVEDEFEVQKKAIPVIGLTKVNGKYYYRRYYMGLI